MAVYTNTHVAAYVDSLGFHAFADTVNLDASFEERDATVYASGGWRRRKVGLGQHMLRVEGFQDYATTGVDPTFPISGVGGLNAYTVAPQNLAASLGDPCFIGQGVLNDYQPLTGEVGEMARFGFGWAGTAQMVRGQILHPEAARTATGNGTAVAFTPPTASQALYASFHVLSVSGTGTITFNVQTDDNSGMTTPTTRITSSAFAAVGGQVSSLAGALTSESHARVIWTISGFTSVTFVVAAGVL
ncbi:MAG: hypothetical protein RL134_1443 [Actinomycetota bacterium]|jgi:hypothetical protein